MSEQSNPDRRIISRSEISASARAGILIKPDEMTILPDSHLVRPGLVTAGDTVIVREETRGSMLRSLGLFTLSIFVPPLGSYLRKRADRISKRVYADEMQTLGDELERIGLLGEHPLVASKVMREQVSRSEGSFAGSIFAISGRFEAETDHVSRVLFAWQTPRGEIIFSQVDLHKVAIVENPDATAPTVTFELSANTLLSQPLFAKGAIVRQEFGHPNGYLVKALNRVTFSATNPQSLDDYLVPAGQSKDIVNPRSR